MPTDLPRKIVTAAKEQIQRLRRASSETLRRIAAAAKLQIRALKSDPVGTLRRDSTAARTQIQELQRQPKRLTKAGLAILVLATLAAATPWLSLSRLMHAYLIGVCFWLSISLGALFFVVLQHLTRARWSVVVRRIAELIASTLPTTGWLMLPIVVPLLFGSASLYKWNDQAIREADPLVIVKAPYLNAPFFTLRCVIYFVAWSAMARFYLRKSTEQDRTNDFAPTQSMRFWSGPCMLIFAITVNFAAFDWLMSLDPHWFSTIFGVYFFAGCAVAIFAAIPLAAAVLQGQGAIQNEITTEHYHDLGKLLFGFTFFWAYIAFSQFLLIWYANIPEETVWFLRRQQHGWQYVAVVLIMGHFALPFFGLMSRASRRNRSVLTAWAMVLLVMHWVDLYWVAMPSASPKSAWPGMVELFTLVGVGAIWTASLLQRLDGAVLIPTGDPYLAESLEFHNV
ncbi:MAG: quinol:cytochrome C oxidoreductase [Planctomycetota bacterium]